MTRAARSSPTIIAWVTLVFGTLMVTAALVLIVVTRPSSITATRLTAPDAGIVVTPVPTLRPVSSLVPSTLPTRAAANQPLPLSFNAGMISESYTGLPINLTSAVPQIIPGPLVDPALRPLSGPVNVPLEMRIPALNITAPVLGVGLTMTNAMAAPIGLRPDDITWQTVFWYRGGGIPGDIGTATFAGHFDDEIGRPAIFAYLADLQVGDLIVVEDLRSGLEVPFIVTETKNYTEQESADPATLARIFGSSAVSAAEPQSISERVSRLTLITCAGEWVNGSFDRHLVVYATRANYPL